MFPCAKILLFKRLAKKKSPFFFVIHIIYVNFASEKIKKMARPIKENPILYGKDTCRFEARMKERRQKT